MPADMNASLPLIVLGLILLALAVWVFTRLTRKTTLLDDGSAPTLARDVLDEGAARAQRNQALIDAAPAAAVAMPTPVAAPAVAPVPEPVAPPTPEPTPAPVAETPAPAPAPAASAAADDLTRIKGVGPKLVALLGELGVTTYADIAAWSDADVARIDAELGRFKGRITRDQWVEQAKLLTSGDETAFTEKFGRNG